MPHIERTIDIVWEGNLARGNGAITGRSGAFTGLPFSLPSRIGAPEGKTSPEELLAAAHAGCLTMSITGELTGAGTPPERLEVTCTVVMDEVEGQGHEIVASHVTISGADVPDEILARADEGCPFSRLLKKAGVEVTITRS
ncbi:MAG TPA: OsmC family peroxiredoxin [Gaiellaceae bacterium]|jgi:osmotically inducible protein OsmC